MCWHLTSIFLLLGFLQRILAIEHDSICIDDDVCPEPSHTVMRLRERDDKKAQLIAKQYGLEVKGKPFLDGTYYFVSHLSKEHSRRHKREIISRLQEHPDVLLIEEQRPRVRRKRDFVYPDTVDDSDESAKVTRRAGTVTNSEQRIHFAQRVIPVLPFPDPLERLSK